MSREEDWNSGGWDEAKPASPGGDRPGVPSGTRMLVRVCLLLVVFLMVGFLGFIAITGVRMNAPAPPNLAPVNATAPKPIPATPTMRPASAEPDNSLSEQEESSKDDSGQ